MPTAGVEGTQRRQLRGHGQQCGKEWEALEILASLLLVVRPGAPSSFLLLVAMPGAPSSVLAPSCYDRVHQLFGGAKTLLLPLTTIDCVMVIALYCILNTAYFILLWTYQYPWNPGSKIEWYTVCM